MNAGGRLLAGLLWAILLVTPALAETWTVVAGDDATEVVFKSKATLESFEGRTRAVTGWIKLEPPGTIAWRIHEARSRLRKSLNPKRAPVRKQKKQSISSELTRLLNVCGLPVPLPA